MTATEVPLRKRCSQDLLDAVDGIELSPGEKIELLTRLDEEGFTSLATLREFRDDVNHVVANEAIAQRLHRALDGSAPAAAEKAAEAGREAAEEARAEALDKAVKEAAAAAEATAAAKAAAAAAAAAAEVEKAKAASKRQRRQER